MALTTEIAFSVRALATKALDLAAAHATHWNNPSWKLANGTGDGQADLAWSDQRTLAGAADETIDLAGSLVDPFGDPVVFARVKMVMVTAAATNSDDVIVGGASANAWLGPFAEANDTIAVQPGGMLLLVAPGETAWPVVSGTGDLLKIENAHSTAAATYNIVLVGASA